METRKAKFGEDHPKNLKSMCTLASIYHVQDRWKEAEELQVQVIKINQMNLGDDHSNTLASMHDLALTYRSQGRWEEAKKLQELVMVMREIKFQMLVRTIRIR